MKLYYFFLTFIVSFFANLAMAQIEGTVFDKESGKPIAGATVRLHKANLKFTTNNSGKFMLMTQSLPDSITVSYVGFQQQTIHVDLINVPLTIFLQASISAIDEVLINTGYYNLPKERATGSFSVIGQEILERSPSKNILERLEGYVPGLVFDKRMNYSENPNNSISIRIRGESSIHSNLEPLIILDNFPYEGDLNTIDPNEIEQITVLKDAAAASIWGARAGNGVIVLTSKRSRGTEQQPRMTFNTGMNIEPRPDFFKSPNYLNSSSFMEAEKLFFERGLYTAQESNLAMPVLSPMVEILIAQRDGLLTEGQAQHKMDSLRAIDVRKEAGRDLYRTAINQQHSLSVRGGSNAYHYSFNVGWNKNTDHIIGNNHNRFTFSSQQGYKLWKWLEIEGNISYSNTATTNNGIGLVGLNVYPYTRFSDDHGNATILFRDLREGYVSNPPERITLDWQYRPLDDIKLNDRQKGEHEIRLGGMAKSTIISGLNLSLRYVYREMKSMNEDIVHPDSYYIRNQKNRFTQPNGSSVFPDGGIYRSFTGSIVDHNGRAQLDFGKRNGLHDLIALVGVEIREVVNSRGRRELYGYNPEYLTSNSRIDYFTRYNILPRGTALIPTPINIMTSGTDRFLSYFANAAYTYQDKYTWSGSVRKDASNLFGVKTNQKWTPLWSTGLLWNISKEDFYDLSWLSDLKLRATYGYSGNVNNSITAYVTARYANSGLTGQRMAHITSPGNPQLQWEKVSTGNLALDFKMLKGRISGTAEYFIKEGRNLLGEKRVDPTNGLGVDPSLRNYVNYASTRSNGFDFTLLTVNTTGRLKWDTRLYLSYVKDRVTNYDKVLIHYGSDYLLNRVPPVIGRSLNSLYALPPIKLDPSTGDPIVWVENEQSKDYAGFYRQLSFSDLTYFGSNVPLFTGSMMNTWSFKKLTMSIHLIGKADYYFMAPSINYKDLFEYRGAHTDFDKRWMKPGDETQTNIPSFPSSIDQYREHVFLKSSDLVERGDHIRIKDMDIAYRFLLDGRRIKGLTVGGNLTNLGFLYRANNKRLDPELRNNLFSYPNPTIYSLRIRVEL